MPTITLVEAMRMIAQKIAAGTIDGQTAAKSLRAYADVADGVVAALEWCGGHAYAGGKAFRDVDPVKTALACAAGKM